LEVKAAQAGETKPATPNENTIGGVVSRGQICTQTSLGLKELP